MYTVSIDFLNEEKQPIDEMHLLAKKMATDEKVVRKTLVKVWNRILDKYSHPGTPLPTPEALKRELLGIGVDAAVDAVVDEHWFVFTWMIRDEIRTKVEEGLDRINLADLIEDVRVAQHEPEMIPQIKAQIKRYVMQDF